MRNATIATARRGEYDQAMTYTNDATNTHVCQYCGRYTDEDGREMHGNSVCPSWQSILHVVYKRI